MGLLFLGSSKQSKRPVVHEPLGTAGGSSDMVTAEARETKREIERERR